MIQLADVETDKFKLEVFECDCGFHIGLDATYIDQVEEIEIECPSCKEMIKTKEICSESTTVVADCGHEVGFGDLYHHEGATCCQTCYDRIA